MKHKKLQVLLLVLLSGCTPGIEKVLKQIQAPGSGYLYFYNIQSIPDELAVMKNVLQSLDSMTNPTLNSLIKDQMKRTAAADSCLTAFINDTTAKFQNSFQHDRVQIENSAILVHCARIRPPYPCPPTDSSYLSAAKYAGYFTQSPWGNVEIYKDGHLLSVLNKSSFDNLTKIRIIRVPRNLKIKNGDTIILKLPVEYRNKAAIMERKIIEYKEVIKFKK
jgi:hypothetical protein